ncbi:MAG TPA: ATP-binding protein [Candidatus Nanoarchaeia archaeon]|nr:ATP-binding protein [Candidatus Nanoarchaeia archaeon]
MIAKDTLRQVVAQQKNEIAVQEGMIPREILAEVLSWFKDNRIIILTGIRRSGKSTLLKQIMQHKTDYCYVNFEDERFIEFKAGDFEQLNEVLIESYGNPGIYLFDEIQNVEKFETFVRRLQDQGKKVVITGSNASLLSKELGTRLTGRYKSFEVYPFSFREYLLFKNINYKKDWFYIAEKKVKLTVLFNAYASEGGFPEYLKTKDREYIRILFENILYRDIIARYAIKRQRIIKELVNILATNIACLFTYNALKKTLGLANAITVKEYIAYLNNSYLFFEMSKFDFSIKKQLNAPKKIYLIDSVFHQLGLSLSMNRGNILENIVFVELRRRKKEVYYYSNAGECDFVVKEGAMITEAMQVCYSLNQDNREREIAGLLEVMGRFELRKAFILTQEQEDDIKVKNKVIRVLPVWKWLLEIR